jgi:hypothetical protein
LGKTIALRFEIVRFLKKPALYALKTLNFKLTLPSLAHVDLIRQSWIQQRSMMSLSYHLTAIVPLLSLHKKILTEEKSCTQRYIH